MPARTAAQGSSGFGSRLGSCLVPPHHNLASGAAGWSAKR
jgi:hypothetical protein